MIIDPRLNKMLKSYLQSVNSAEVIDINQVKDFISIIEDLQLDLVNKRSETKIRFVKSGNSDYSPISYYMSTPKIINLPYYLNKIEWSADTNKIETIEDFLRRGGKKQVFQYIPVSEQQFVKSVSAPSNNQYSLTEGELYFSDKSKERKSHKFNLDLIGSELVEELANEGIILFAAKKRGRKTYV